MTKAARTLDRYRLETETALDRNTAFSELSDRFQQEAGALEQQIEAGSQALEHAFAFLETAFGKSQELVVFVTELNTNFFSTQFIQENGSAAYSRNNKELMIGKQRRELMQDISKLQDFLQGL